MTEHARARVREALQRHGITPCGDSACMFGAAKGMTTNGGCSCFEWAAPRARAALHALARVIAEVAEQDPAVARIQQWILELRAAGSLSGNFIAAEAERRLQGDEP